MLEKQRHGKPILFFVLAVCLVSFCILPSLFNPLRKPSIQIRDSLLEQFPPGTSLAQVKAFIASRGWRVYDTPDLALDPKQKENQQTGRLTAVLGEYSLLPWEHGFPFGGNVVYGIWIFDAKDRLVNFSVEKNIDLP
jgi:hypothetical protein